jgi:hypothetical protein
MYKTPCFGECSCDVSAFLKYFRYESSGSRYSSAYSLFFSETRHLLIYGWLITTTYIRDQISPPPLSRGNQISEVLKIKAKIR